MKKCIFVLFSVLLVLGLCSCDPNRAELDAMQQRIADLETKLEEAHTEREEMRQSLEADISLLHARCNTLTEHDLEFLDDLELLENVVEDYNKCLTDDLANLKSVEISAIKGDISTLKTATTELSEKLEVTEEIEGILEQLALMESRINSHYHINLSTGAYELHTFEYEINEEYHLYKCTVCGYVDTNKSSLHFYDGFITNNLIHQQVCEDCNYTEGEKPHILDYAGAGTTEAEWNENFPVMESLHVRGTISAQGSWKKIIFSTLPNLKRDSTQTLTCADCHTTLGKVVNLGNGTADYLLTYSVDLGLENYVQDADEYMLRLYDMAGTRFLYLRNYSVSSYSGDLKIHEWKCIGKTFQEWGFEDQVWTCVYEGGLEDKGKLADIVDWGEGNADWGTLGYIIEGDVYCMGFGTGNYYNKVSYVATDAGFVERPYGNDITHEVLP